MGKPYGRRPTGKPRRVCEGYVKVGLREVHCEVDGTGSRSFPMADFGISYVQPSVSAIRVKVGVLQILVDLSCLVFIILCQIRDKNIFYSFLENNCPISV
jgi:hypothetical protein